MIQYTKKPMNPINDVPAIQTFAIMLNSSLLGFLANLSTLIYSSSFRVINSSHHLID